MELRHPSATKGRLLSLAQEVAGARMGLKIAALLLVLEGQRLGWVSEVLGLTRMSLNRWIHRVNESGVAALKTKPRRGRPCRLSAKLARRLEAHLDDSPQAFGLNRAHWDGPTLVVHLKRQFGITLKVRQAQMWMHRLGYRLKRASYSYMQGKAAEARKFQRALKKN